MYEKFSRPGLLSMEGDPPTGRDICSPFRPLVVVQLLLQGKLPVRWMALESLEDYSYSSESDV